MAEQTPTSEPKPAAEGAAEPLPGAGEARSPEETATITAPPTAATGGTGADPQAAAASEATVPHPAPAGGAAVAASTADGPAPVGAPAAPAPAGGRGRADAPTGKQRRTFKEWRGARPFWGGLLVFLGGGEILFTEKMPLPVILHIGMQGLAGFLVPSVMALCGLLLIFSPGQRLFYSVLSVLLTLASWVTSNLGGFFIGLLLGLIGSILAFGWLPNQPARRRLLRRGTRPSTP
ncbi:DUF6114 domain-containing protein [Kitasatospora humi]|uniref:DUF6114 domain-containing protein n=1 Tax=Kitasatospora humi TaxID=2893891 RepID=UPI0035565DAF